MKVEKFYYQSPVGSLEIVCENDFVVSLRLTEMNEKTDSLSDFLKDIKTQLDGYFSGKRKTFNVKLNPKGTEFQKKVWAELLKIPFGRTKSYSQIAEAVGNKNAQRAVGSACNKNPIMLIIPCHRVLSKNGNLTGYAHGIELKARLLDFERS